MISRITAISLRYIVGLDDLSREGEDIRYIVTISSKYCGCRHDLLQIVFLRAYQYNLVEVSLITKLSLGKSTLQDSTISLRIKSIESYRSLLAVSVITDCDIVTNYTVKADRFILTSTCDDSLLQSNADGFYQEHSDIVIQECRSKLKHVLLNLRECRQLILCDLNSSECFINLLGDSSIDRTPYSCICSTVRKDPSGEIAYIDVVNCLQERMSILYFSVHILQDGHRHTIRYQ